MDDALDRTCGSGLAGKFGRAADFNFDGAATSFGLIYQALFTSSKIHHHKNLSNLKVKLSAD